MKKTFLFLSLIITSIWASAQTFEGKVLYQNRVTSKVKEMTDQQWTDLLGSQQEYYIKNENYKSISNGTMFSWQLYLGAENKIYNKLAKSPSVFWIDAGQQEETISKIEVVMNAATVLGYPCNMVVINTPTSVEKYFYNEKFKIDASQFEKHKYGNWAAFVAKSNALPLKSIIEKQQFTIISEAKSIKAINLSDSLFEIPSGFQITKSPY